MTLKILTVHKKHLIILKFSICIKHKKENMGVIYSFKFQ